MIRRRLINEAMSKSYSEKLKDPRWQKKRLEILERDKYICQECDIRWTEMHVHHKYYKRNTEPWEYDGDALVSLCDNCHRQTHYQLNSGLDRSSLAYIKKLGEETGIIFSV